MNQELDLLLQKLDSFIRKYYKNQIIRGVLLASVMYLTYYIIVSVLEYYGRFSTPIRSAMFFTAIVLYVLVFVKFILIPLLHFARIGKVISHRQAAEIVSKHFTDLQDKLLNTLELADMNQSNDLVLASLEQRIRNIKPIPFNTAIDFRKNLHYAKYLGAILLLFTVILAFSPKVFTESTKRIVNYNTYFEPEAPFHIVLINDTLAVQRGGDYQIKVKVEGKYVPNDVSIVYGGNTFLMTPDANSKSKFTYQFKNINNSIDLHFTAETFRTQKYTLAVLPTPLLVNFKLNVEPPAYTNEAPKVYENVGDITIPCGSKLTWQMDTKDMDKLEFTFNDSLKAMAQKDKNSFSLTKVLKQSLSYKVSMANQFFSRKDVVSYSVNVVPDLYPTIDVMAKNDSANFSMYYFKGTISDDYGFKRLTFNYFTKSNPQKITSIPVQFAPNLAAQEYFYMFDFAGLKLEQGSQISYYFEVYDNDGINGSKASRTQMFEFKIPTAKELQDLTDKSNENIQAKMNQGVQLANELKQAIKKLQESAVDQSKSAWEKSKMMKDVLQKQNQLDKLLNDIKKDNQEKDNRKNSFTPEDEALLEKQKEIEKMMDELMTDDIKKLLEQIKQLQNEFKDQDFKNVAQDLKNNYDELSKQLDKNLELLKKFEVEQKVENVVNRLEKLSEEQDKLSKESEDKKSNSNELLKKQDEQKKEFEDISKEYKEALDKNKELEKPFNMDDYKQESQEIDKEMKQSEQDLKNNDKKKAAQKQKSASAKMKDMAQKMQKKMQGQKKSENAENEQDLRQIMDNLVKFSFDQERLMKELGEIKNVTTDPKYMSILTSQRDLNEDFSIIRDSLNALAKRTPKIGTPIKKEVLSITKNLEQVINNLEDHNSYYSRNQQQQIMTSANNLALLFSEALESMQNQQQGSGGEGDDKMKIKSKKKKSGKQEMGDLRKQQEGLKQQLEQALKQMQGKDGKPNSQGQGKEMAQMLAQQEIFRKMLDDMKQKGGLQPKTMKQLDEIGKMMDNNIKDIVNKNITPITINRQQQIVTRMLEAEKAESERENEEKRESKESKAYKLSKPQEIFKDKSVNLKFKEGLNTTNLKLHNYYQNKYKDYLLRLKE